MREISHKPFFTKTCKSKLYVVVEMLQFIVPYLNIVCQSIIS